MTAHADFSRGERMLSPDEVARALGVSRSTVGELIFWGRKLRGEHHPLKGSLWPAVALGWRTVRIPAAAVERLVEFRARLACDPARLAAARIKARALGTYGRSGMGATGRARMAA